MSIHVPNGVSSGSRWLVVALTVINLFTSINVRAVSLPAGGIEACTTPPVVDPTGCRSNSDFGDVILDSNESLQAQIARCSALCCSIAECDSWAVREKYQPGWAHNCSADGGHNCCLLKKKGWRMDASVPGCTSGGRTPAPPVPGPPPPPPPSPPLPNGGGSCSSDWECSLGGVCTSGRCVCDVQYTGPNCGVLHLRKAKPDNGMQVNGTHTWGGHALQDKESGKWVGFFSYMAGRCDLGVWQSQSTIISAVADSPDGPYDQNVQPTIGPESHNAMISQHPNGSYFLFHIGSGDSTKPIKQCDPNNPDPYFPFPAGHPAPPAANTHIADSLSGPWRKTFGIPSVNNPAVFFFPNGTTLLYDRQSVRSAPAVEGPWSKGQPSVVQNGSMVPEDPFVYKDGRGNFHMLFNANSGHKNCPAGIPCGGHAWSHDGLSWSLPIWPAFGTIVHYTDNSTVTYDFCERPQIIQNDDGSPRTFFAGHGYSNIHTLAINFCQEGDLDCVTTVQ